MSTRFTALTIRVGDAFLLEEDNGWNCLFDSGIDGKVVDLLKFKGIDKLDLAICSHNDVDHANGFISLLQSNIKIDEIWLPSFWLSILQYVQKKGIDWAEIDQRNEDISNRMKEGLNPQWIFSNDSKPISEDESNYTLSFFAECPEYELDRHFHDIVRRVTYELEAYEGLILSKKVVCKVAECVIDNLIEDKDQNLVIEIIKQVIIRLYPVLGNSNAKYGIRRIKSTLRDLLSDHRDLYLIKSASSANEIKKIKEYFGNIRNLAVLAHRRRCKIKWFEPTKSYTIMNERLSDYSGFFPLNSDECPVSKLQDDIIAFALAVRLTEVNEFSLAFEYFKKGVPIIRFSADSDCIYQTATYDGAIVTAPHHGSEANANVYSHIKGDNIIWVRSDRVSGCQGRPCNQFKSMKNKYCLACETFNFISEISFEYDPCHKKWQHIHGEQCRCKV